MKELCTYTKFDLNDRKLLRGGYLAQFSVREAVVAARHK